MTLSDYNIINNFRQGFRDAFKDVVGFEGEAKCPLCMDYFAVDQIVLKLGCKKSHSFH